MFFTSTESFPSKGDIVVTITEIHDLICQRVTDQMTAETKLREEQVRRELVTRVRDAIRHSWTVPGVEDLSTAMAEAAVDAFIEFYRTARRT
jgi:hypothetical protein